jgi:Tol biopolymer transport system component
MREGRLFLLGVSLFAACAGSLLVEPPAAWGRVVQRVSLASDGSQATGPSSGSPISADGRFIAFQSAATDLVPGDTNGLVDVFVHDRLTGQTTRVSVASDGTQATGGSVSPALSADGRFVAFFSDAPNLVPGDTNGLFDVFVHDRLTGETTRVSVASGGAQATGGDSLNAVLSADGRFVAFASEATNLVPGDTNGATDVFVRDRLTGQTTRVSVASDGAQATGTSFFPAISGDGRFVAFDSDATNLVPFDTNGFSDVFVRDRLTGETTRVSVASGGAQATGGGSRRPALSGDGRFVVFDSGATDLVPGDTNGLMDIFVHDRLTGQTARVNVSAGGAQATGGDSSTPALAADGRFVAFPSLATNLVPDDTGGFADVFVAGPGLALVIRGTDDGIYENRFDGVSWSGWTALPGATADIPGLASSGDSMLDLVVRGTDDGVYHNHFEGGTWSGWTALPGATADIPALAASGGGVLDLVVRGIDDGVYHNHYDGVAWAGWTALPGATADIPALAASGGGVLDLVVRGTDNSIYHNHYDGVAWGGWTALPGATLDIPALAASGSAVLDLVVRGTDNGVYHNHFDGTTWSGWTAVGGSTSSRPALVVD